MHAIFGLALVLGAALIAGPALALTAHPSGHLNVRSGPGFQYPVIGALEANLPATITGCLADYSWCSLAGGGVTGWSSAGYLITNAGGKITNLHAGGAALGVPVVVPTVETITVTAPVGVMVGVPHSVGVVEAIVPAPEIVTT
jgi:uncharacterized protein YraI